MPDASSPYAAERVSFGRRVRELREARGWTQERLAEALTLDRKTVNRLENGTFSPSLDRVFQLARVLEVAAGSLFGED